MTERQGGTSVWVDQGEARELLFQALATSYGSDLACLIDGVAAGGNPRPLAGFSPEQLRGVSGQLEEMGIEIRQTLNAEAQVGLEVSLDAAQEIVAAEMRAKSGPTSSAWTRP